MVMTPQETHDVWWIKHWIQNCDYLVMRIEQMLDGEDVETIMRKILPEFKDAIKRSDGIGNR